MLHRKTINEEPVSVVEEYLGHITPFFRSRKYTSESILK